MHLQRQIIHATSRIGLPKVDSAAQVVADINPDVRLVPIRQRLDKDNARAIFRDFQVVADGSDNFPTRFLVNDAARLEGKTLEAHATPDEPGRALLVRASEAGNLSARGWTRTLRLARTIAADIPQLRTVPSRGAPP